MQRKILEMSRRWFRLLTVVATLASLIVICGCSGSGIYGTMQRDRALDQQFVSHQVLPDYTYYFSGGYGKPEAILGIHKDYQLVPGLWQSIEISPAQLEKWIDAISPEDYKKGGYFAAYLLDPDGKRAGIWYSIQDSTVVKFPGENKIEVYTPDLVQPGRRGLRR